jgi:TonB-linked SusC/RagA family outer membrane protein
MNFGKLHTILLATLLGCATTALGQGSASVSGTVLDDNKQPLAGVSVALKGSTTGVFTGVAGDYTLIAPADGTLIFSFVGLATHEEIVGGRARIDVVLQADNLQLEEVVVVGYGSQKVKDLTAPIAVVKGADLAKMATSNAAQALQGKVAGVQVVNSGAPGSSATVKIRGTGSIGDYAKPLYIVDGTFVENIDFLSANDIETMNVLKDASASAIYGVRAANGVILITTRRGSSRKPSVSYDGYVGVQVPVDVMPLANKEQYLELLNRANEGMTGFPRTADKYPGNTDWYSELLRPAVMHNHSLDVSGLSEGGTSYSVGLSYLSQDGIMNTDNGYQRYNLRGRFEQKVTSWLKVGATTIVSDYDRRIARDEAFLQAFVNPPLYNVFNENNADAYPVKYDALQLYEGYEGATSYSNPVAMASYKDNREWGKKWLFSAFAELNIIDQKLTFKTSYNQDYTSFRRKDYSPENYVGGAQGIKQSRLRETFENKTMQIIDNLLTYTDSQGEHRYTVLLGQSTRMERRDNLWGSAVDVPGVDEQSIYLKTGSQRDRGTDDDAHAYNGLSAFARATYSFSSKYLASLTFRADASSKYQEKWGYFPSVGVGWVLTEEDFLRNSSAIDFLKLRASWGMLGNDNIPANSTVITGTRTMGSSAIFNDVLVDGVGAQTVAKNYLRWEVVSEWNLGVDAAFMQKRLSVEADFYYRVTDNVVFNAPISSGGGVVELLANNGKVLNSGVELTLGWTDKLGKLAYNVGLNASTVHNEVLALNGSDYIPGASVRGGFATRTAVGHPIGSFYGYEVVGVYQSAREQGSPGAGFFKYWDNGDGALNEDDKKYLGSAIPWLMGGIDFGLSYANFDASITLQGQLGNKILNAKRMNRDAFADGNYDLDFYENAWSKDNGSTTYPSPAAYNSGLTQITNSFFVEDGSYFRIQNVQLGYTFKIGTKNLAPQVRLYLSALRPLTLFGYNGFSPEVGGIPAVNTAKDIFATNSDPISMGVDYNNVYPSAAVYSVGVKINF